MNISTDGAEMFDVRTEDAHYTKNSELVWQQTCLAACNACTECEFIPPWEMNIKI